MTPELPLDADGLKCLLHAFKLGAKFIELKGDIYAYQSDETGWRCWKLKTGSQDYAVTATTCACAQYTRRGLKCKHIEGLEELLAESKPKRREGRDRRHSRG